MARAIDASELMVEIQVCSWDSEQDKERAEDLVLGMSTLTPPNEPLTLEDAKKERYIWFTPLFQSTHPARGATANFTKEQRVCLAQFAYLHKGKKAEHTKTNAPMLH